MNILITGGAGYIGSVTAELFLNNKHNVIIYDDLSTGFLKLVDKRAKFVKGSILNYSLLCKTIKENKIDLILHLAAKIVVSESVRKPTLYHKVNVNGTANILNAMERLRVNKILFASSAAVYGNIKKSVITENSIKKPCNPYGETKLIGEQLIKNHKKTHKNFNYVCLRLFNVAGASDSGKYGLLKIKPYLLIPCINDSFRLNKEFNIFGNNYKTIDKTASRDYIDVNDIAKAFFLSSSYVNKKSGIFNIGNQKGSTVKQIYDEACKVLKKKPNFIYKPNRPGDPDNLLASNQLAKKELKWKPTHSIKQMILADYKYRNKNL